MSEHNHHDRENPCPVCHNESKEIARLRALNAAVADENINLRTALAAEVEKVRVCREALIGSRWPEKGWPSQAAIDKAEADVEKAISLAASSAPSGVEGRGGG